MHQAQSAAPARTASRETVIGTPTARRVTEFYANDNPVRNVDPDGRQAIGAETAIDWENKAYLSGTISADQLRQRQGARAVGAVIGVGALAGGWAAASNPYTAVKAVNAIADTFGGEALGGGTLAAGGYVATKGAARAIEILRPEGRLIGQAGSTSKIRMLQGSQAEAKRFFSHLVNETGATPVAKQRLDGFAVLPEGGGTIGFRSVSSSGPPTIDTRIPGLGIREIKFIDEH